MDLNEKTSLRCLFEKSLKIVANFFHISNFLPRRIYFVLITLLSIGCYEAVTVSRIIDGDTIEVMYQGKVEKVRLLRIDTPERGERGFYEAKEALSDLIGRRAITLEFETPGELQRDRYGRLLCYVFLEGVNINVEMVKRGHSKFWTKYGEGKYAEDFRKAEKPKLNYQ